MSSLPVQTLVVSAASWVLWHLFRALFPKSTLQNLPGPARTSVITGNLASVYSPRGIPWHHDMVKRYGRAYKINGLFGDEQVHISDPRALHQITVKDQYIYEETAMFLEGNALLFGRGLIATLGDRHKRQRKVLNPVFSIAHMRNLVPIFHQITHRLRDAIEKRVKNGPTELDMLNWMSRTALEYIGQGGLGYSFETFDKESTNEYSVAVKDLFPAVWNLMLYRQFLPFLVKIGPPSFRRWAINFIPSQNLKKLVKIVDIMDNTSREVFEAKKAALAAGDEVVASQVGEGKDIMSVLLRENMLVEEKDRLSDEELLGQMNTLIFAAHDTTSSALAHMLHLLSEHPGVQDRLRKEVTEARANLGDMSYDELIALPYLDAFVRETLRLYAPFTFVSRTTRRDVVLPLGTPVIGVDGKPIESLFLRNNTNLILGLSSANRDPAIWGEDAEEFNPDRWIGRQPEDVAKEKLPGVYSGMMTFLSGSRACIGFKFSQLEMKVVLSMLVEKFKFELSDKEIVWLNSSIQTPTTKGKETGTPHLPLMVSLV